jgi:hypothetical protein
LAAVAALADYGTAAGAVLAQQTPQGAVTPPPTTPNAAAPTPAPVLATPAPSPTPAPSNRRGRGGNPSPGASETPAPPQFQSLDGVWEVELQPLNGARTVYSHLYVTQKGDDVSGTWARTSNQRLAFSGTFDGRLFTFTAKDGATTYTMTGYAENFSDMVGLLKSSDPKDQGTPFTAEHRKKERIGE